MNHITYDITASWYPGISMLENTAIRFATSKLASTSLLPGSLFLIGGIVIWQLWRKQTHLQNETSELSKKLNDEIRDLQKQLEDFKLKDPNPTSQQMDKPVTENSPEKMGLFEFLINDNIKIRQ